MVVTGVGAMSPRNDSVGAVRHLTPSPPLPPHRRLAAWLVCGPLGHLAAGVADWVGLAARYAWARTRRREPWGP